MPHVGRLLREMSAAEISGWMAFYLLDEEAAQHDELEADAIAERLRAGRKP